MKKMNQKLNQKLLRDFISIKQKKLSKHLNDSNSIKRIPVTKSDNFKMKIPQFPIIQSQNYSISDGSRSGVMTPLGGVANLLMSSLLAKKNAKEIRPYSAKSYPLLINAFRWQGTIELFKEINAKGMLGAEPSTDEKHGNTQRVSRMIEVEKLSVENEQSLCIASISGIF